MAEQFTVGGLSEEKAADAEVQEKCEKVKEAVLTKVKEAAQNYTEFTAVAYKTQVVAGTNYFVKVKVGDNNYIELRIFQPLDPKSALILSGVLEGLKADSPIVYFE